MKDNLNNWLVELSETDKRDLIARKLGKEKLIDFAVIIDKKYKVNWHHELIADKLQQAYEKVLSGKRARIILELPPRHGKSNLATIKFPAYVLGKNPDFPVIVTSYSQDLSTDFGLATRDIMNSSNYQGLFDTRLRADTQAKARWLTKEGGGYVACGIGGPISGRGFKIGIIDDPIKNREEADSEVIREKHWKWYRSTFLTREEGNGAIIVIMCMTGDTNVAMADGSFKMLRDIVVGDYVLSWKGGLQVKSKVLNKLCQGKDDIIEIKTGNNSVKANARHPFLTEDGWKETGKIVIGDRLVVSGKEKHSKRTINKDEAWLLGFMFGDGWVTRNKKLNEGKYRTESLVTCACYGVRESVNNKVLWHFYKIFGCRPKKTKYGYYRTEIAKVGRWFLSHGLTGKAKTKRLPIWLFGENFTNRLSFLKGFVAADGHIDKSGRTIINLHNKWLIEDIRKLARGCGFKPTNVYSCEREYQPPHSPRPIMAIGYNVQWSKKRSNEEFYLNRVRSINKVGKEVVYDLQIENTKCFIADGVVSHNTRWHDDDLVGRILESDKNHEWEVIKFPAIAEQDEEFRKKGEALWSWRFPLDILERRKKDLGPYEFSALYQQDPVDIESREFKKEWFHPRKFEEVLKLNTRRFITIDPAWAMRDKSDFIGITINYVDTENVWNLRSFRVKMNSMELINLMFTLTKEINPEKIGIEEGAYKSAIKPFLDEEMKKRNTFFTLTELKHKQQEKNLRIRGLIPRYSSGGIYHIENECGDLEGELLRFPKGVNDDVADSLAYQLQIAEAPGIQDREEFMRIQNTRRQKILNNDFGL